MNREIIEILNKLKIHPKDGKIDHIAYLRRLSDEYSNGIEELEPVAIYFLNGIDELPSLSEKNLWNEKAFENQRKNLTDYFDELLRATEESLKNIQKAKPELFSAEEAKTSFLEEVKNGKTSFQNLNLANVNLRKQQLENITFTNCFISADFRNAKLKNSKFIKCNLKTSDFRNADLTNAIMQNVSFESTKFRGSNTTNFKFIDNYCNSEEGIGQNDFEDWINDTE